MWMVEKGNGKYKFTERYEDRDHKQKYVSVTLKSKSPQAFKQAQKILDDKIRSRLEAIPEPTADYTFKEVTEKWLEVKKKTVKPSTVTSYVHVTDLIIKHIGDEKIATLTAGTINQMLLSMFNSGLKYKTVSERYKLTKNIIKFAVDYDYLATDHITPKMKLEKINLSEKNSDKYLEVKEADALFKRMAEAGEEELSDMFNLQMQTGMRIGEVIALHLPDIDLVNKTILIRYTYDKANDQFTLPKGNKTRTIHISSKTVELIQKILLRRNLLLYAYGIKKTQLLFFTEKGKPFNSAVVNNKLHKFEEPNKPLTTHIFRHTFVTRMVENNIPSKLIADHVGHVDTKLVDNVYSHFTNKMNEDLKNAIELVQI